MFQRTSSIEKLYARGGGAILRRKMFCLILPKNFVGDPSLFDKISGIEKFFARGGYHDFQSGGGGGLTVPKL